MSNFAPNLSTGPCLYCNGMAKMGPEDMLQCGLCHNIAHISCLKSGMPDGRLLGDNFFNFICSGCHQGNQDYSFRAKLSIPQLLLLVLYNLHMTEAQSAQSGFFHWEMHIFKYINQHWKEIFGYEWHTEEEEILQTSLSGQLSHYGPYFESGSKALQDGGWHKLRMVLPPAQLINQFTAEESKEPTTMDINEEFEEVSIEKEEVGEEESCSFGDIALNSISHDDSSQGVCIVEKERQEGNVECKSDKVVMKKENDNELQDEIDVEFTNIDANDDPSHVKTNGPSSSKSALFNKSTGIDPLSTDTNYSSRSKSGKNTAATPMSVQVHSEYGTVRGNTMCLTTMAEWSENTVLQFISYYEEKTLLWDTKHARHFNKIHRNDAWIEIAQKTGKTVEECKKKMTSLLAAMRREKAKTKKSIETGKGADEVYKSTWFAFKSMQFLWEKDKPRETTSTIPEREIADSLESEMNVSQTVEDQPVLPTTHATTTERTPISSHNGSRKKKALDRRLDSAFKILTSCAPTNDEAQDFGNFAAKKLRKYDSFTRSAVQHAIMGIFLNADMGLFQRHPLSTHCGPSNPYGLYSVAQPPFPVVNMPPVTHLTHPPTPFDTRSTSSTPQPTGPLSFDTRSTSSTPQPTGPLPFDTPSTSCTSQPREQYGFSPTSSDDELSLQDLI